MKNTTKFALYFKRVWLIISEVFEMNSIIHKTFTLSGRPSHAVNFESKSAFEHVQLNEKSLIYDMIIFLFVRH
jgi:hypothetical protein